MAGAAPAAPNLKSPPEQEWLIRRGQDVIWLLRRQGLIPSRRSAIHLQVKTILNRVQRFVGFVYCEVRLENHRGGPGSIEILVEPHAGIRRRCSRCQRPARGYDCLEQRRWLFVPLWGIPTYFCYAPRRVECAEHGVVVEHISWSEGKRPETCTMMGFLARWARRLSWRDTARAFQASWEAVYRSVEWFVEWGLAHRPLGGVESIGVDEIHWGRGLRADNFLTVIYQIDAHRRRLLWVGRRSQATLRRRLKALGPEVVQGPQFVCSDMWKPYLEVIAAQASQPLHVLDRFHITRHLNEAVDQCAAPRAPACGRRANPPPRRGRVHPRVLAAQQAFPRQPLQHPAEHRPVRALRVVLWVVLLSGQWSGKPKHSRYAQVKQKERQSVIGVSRPDCS